MNVFDPHIHIRQIVIVGVGGTGCQVARIAARMLYDMRRSQLHVPKMILIDPDRCEFQRNCRKVGDSNVTVEKVNEVDSDIPV